MVEIMIFSMTCYSEMWVAFKHQCNGQYGIYTYGVSVSLPMLRPNLRPHLPKHVDYGDPIHHVYQGGSDKWQNRATAKVK